MEQNYYKYPRTPHLPWSPGVSEDDIALDTVGNFCGQNVVVTEKLDGENTTMYSSHIHARSIDSRHHPSRNWVKQFHGQIAHLIPKGWRVCGENVYALHSISYDNLKSYFYMFSIWNEDNRCLNWEDTVEWAELLGMELPTVLYLGIWDQEKIENMQIDTEKVEGYVVRTANGFLYRDFAHHLAKWVRTDHVQSDQHWMHQEVVPNKLRDG